MSIDRRRFLHSSAAALVALMGAGAVASRKPRAGPSASRRCPASLRDAVTVPPEYEWQVLYPWGAPTGIAGSACRPSRRTRRNSAADQAVQAGMHHDGMHFFPLGRVTATAACW